MNELTETDFVEIETFYKTNRKPEHIFPYVSQREDWDCGVACLAMCLNMDYWGIRKTFPHKDPRGIPGSVLVRRLGLNAGHLDRYFPVLKPLEALVNEHKDFLLLTKESRKDWGHYIVLDRNGNIYDPEDGILKADEYARKFVAFSILLN